MKSLFLTAWNSRSYGGVTEVVRQLGQAIVEKGDMDFSVLSFDDKFSDEDRPGYGDIPMEYYHVTNFPVLNKLGVSPDLYKKLCELKPEVIETQGIWMYFSAAALKFKKKFGAKVVVAPHGMLDPWAVKNSAWKKKLVGHLFEYENLHKADCIKALCKSEYDSIREFGLKNPVAIIPNGINLPEGVTYDRQREKKTMLFVGRIHPKKGIRELIEGLALVRETHPGLLNMWQIRIAGWDQLGHTEELIALAEAKGLKGTVSFIGSVFGEKKQEELCKANAFVLTSFSEGLPMSVLEAWAYKLPVLMTDFCNIPEGFEADAAVRVETTPESIAEGLVKMFSMSNERLEQIGNNGFNLVKERFTWEHIADQTHELYKWLTEGGKMPSFVKLD